MTKDRIVLGTEHSVSSLNNIVLSTLDVTQCCCFFKVHPLNLKWFKSFGHGLAPKQACFIWSIMSKTLHAVWQIHFWKKKITGLWLNYSPEKKQNILKSLEFSWNNISYMYLQIRHDLTSKSCFISIKNVTFHSIKYFENIF